MFSDLYDRKYLLQRLLWFVVIAGSMKASGGAGFLLIIPMAYYGLLGKRTEELFFWLLMSICMIIANPHIVTNGAIFAWSQRAFMISMGVVMSVAVVAFPKHKVMKPFLGMMIYVAFMIIPSMVGWSWQISMLKLFLFAVIYLSFFGVANQVGINPKVSSRKIRSIMLSIALFFIVGSVALIPFPALSQLQAGDVLDIRDLNDATSLFMGMANHSQCLGPVVSSISVIVLADLLFSIKKWDPIYLLILLSSPILIYKTSSRTGMGSYVIGMLFVVFIFAKARGVQGRWRSRAMNAIFVALTGAMAVMVCLPGFRAGAKKFALKQAGENAELNKENVMSSRQGLIDDALYNFKKSPIIGNGFQVAPYMIKYRIRGLRDVLSAPVEKGVWITAILEEGGIVGWVIFVLFLVTCIFGSVKRKAYLGGSCLFLLTLTNLGEFSFFSMSYTGGFTWAMVFMGLALDIRKMKDENLTLKRDYVMHPEVYSWKK